MRKPLAACLLQLYALALAAIATMGGVRTDEAKYLLNIPYPHPPLARTLLEATYGLPWNEAFWRVIFATLVIQSVWLVVRLPRHEGSGSRVLLAGAWLLSGAVVLQAASIMMAPLSALGGLVLLWAGNRARSPYHCFLIALFWFASVFVAYQSTLFLPLACGAFLRSGTSKRRTLLYAFGPLIALALYTLTNPLAMQSLIALGGDPMTPAQKLSQFGLLWLVAGTAVISVVGTIGVLLSRRWDWILTLVIVCAYITLSYHAYYAIFLVPLFMAGIASLLDHHVKKGLDLSGPLLAMITSAGCVLAIACMVVFTDRTNPARDTLRLLEAEIRSIDRTDTRLLIVGDFGHEWQYYAPPQIREVLKYSPEMISSDADVVVCWHACDKALLEGKDRMPTPVESWVRRDAALHL